MHCLETKQKALVSCFELVVEMYAHNLGLRRQDDRPRVAKAVD